MKPFILFLALIIFLSPALNAKVMAQTNPVNDQFYYGVEDEGLDPEMQISDQDRDDSILGSLSEAELSLHELNQAFGYVDEQGKFFPGALGRLKLKPTDKKRLIKIANGSLTNREKDQFKYDERLIQLLTLLVTPKDLGGAGLTHLRVADLLRFRNDPRSTETEGTDNVSQHQFGKAADIVEVNTTRCKKKGLLGSKNLAPFPVKVLWQGGTPPNPSLSILGSFDAVARANAFRDILGALPGESYNGSTQNFEDLLQQMQRRVIAKELNLDPSSLDYLIGNNVLETLGRASVNNSLAFPVGALVGNSKESLERSIPTSYLERAFNLPPTSLQGDDWNSSLERLGRMTVAYQFDLDPAPILSGNTAAIQSSPFLQLYKESEAAYRFPPGTIDGIKTNQTSAFRQIGAILIADRLNYSDAETGEILQAAKTGGVKQLNLARSGEISEFPGPILPLIAPEEGSSKAKGEQYLANYILESQTPLTPAPEVLDTIRTNASVFAQLGSRQQIVRFLTSLSTEKSSELYRQIGARYIEKAFDLPSRTLSEAVRQHNSPTFEQFRALLENRLRQEKILPLGGVTAYIEDTLRGNFDDLYFVPSNGPAGFSQQDIFSILIGDTASVSSRAGASWIEESLGLTPNSFSVLFTNDSSEEKLVNAGIAVIAAEIFEAFDVTTQNITNGTEFKRAIGQAKIETVLGLDPGSWHESIASIQRGNSVRFDTLFSNSLDVDAFLALEEGTTDRLKQGTITPESIAESVGARRLDELKTEDLQNKLGWDGQYKVDGEKLLRTITSQDGTTKDVKSGATVTMRQLLAQVGGYNSDFAFGYEPETISKWLSADSKVKNSILMEQGAKLYADRLGLDPNNREEILKSYLKGDGASKRLAVAALKKKLEETRGEVTDEILQTAKDEANDQIDTIKSKLAKDDAGTVEKIAYSQAWKKLDQIQKKLNENESEKSPANRTSKREKKQSEQLPAVGTRDLLNGAITDIATVVLEIKDENRSNTPLLEETRQDLLDLNTRMSGEIKKWEDKNKLPNVKIFIPEEDIESFINGNIKLANNVIVAARQAKETFIEVKDTYELMRIMLSGWGRNPETEKQLFLEIRDRYTAQLEEYAAMQGIEAIGQQLDSADILPYADFERLTKGILKPDGRYSENETPYKGETIEKVKQNFLANKEAKNNFYYGVMDYQIKKTDPSLPKDFSKTLMEGSTKDRSKMIYTYLSGKADQSLVQLLPTDAQGLARDYLNLYDTASEKFKNPEYDPEKELSDQNQPFLSKRDVIDDWANMTVSLALRAQDPKLPTDIGQLIRRGDTNERKEAAYHYLRANFSANLVNSLPAVLRPLAEVYIDNYETATGKFKNPNFKPHEPESPSNQRYLDNNETISNWAESTFNTLVRRLDPALPENAGDLILKGSDLDRKKLAFAFARTKFESKLISTLPKEIQPLAQKFMANFDVESGKIVDRDEIFVDWAGTLASNFLKENVPGDVLKLGAIYLRDGISGLKLYMFGETGRFFDRLGDEIQKKINNFVALGKQKIIRWVGKQLGLSADQMVSYYDKYKQIQSTYKAYKAGKLSTAELVVAVDQILLDGKISKFVGKLDEALGLPAGSTQSLIMFAITGNPLYVLQFAFTVFFGFTVKCPNLQQTAENNVKLLISSILDIGQQNKALVPSQIISFKDSYITDLMDKIQQNYAPCFVEGGRCGVFARYEYARQVHIGF